MIRGTGFDSHSQSRPLPEGQQDQSGVSVRLILGLVAVFAVGFSILVSLKLFDEWSSTKADAEATHARAAAFLSERISGSLQHIDGAITVAISRLSIIQPDMEFEEAQAVTHSLADIPGIHASAVLSPHTTPIFSGGPTSQQWQRAAEIGLEAESGFAAHGDEAFRLIKARGYELPDGTVGALVVLIDPNALIPGDDPSDIIMLTDRDGRLLAMNPSTSFAGAPFAAERLGLDPNYVARIAQDGGIIDNVDLAGEPRVLGLASVDGAPIHILRLGTINVDRSDWNQTLFVHIFLIVAPLGLAIAFIFLLKSQVDRLKKTRSELINSESRLHMAITGARCGVFEWDIERDEVFLTESFAAMMGRSNDTVISGPEFLLLLRQDDRPRMRTALRSATESGDLDVEVRNASLPIWMQLRARMNETTRRVIGIAIDITERKGAQARVTAAENRLRAALESMSESFVLWDARKRLVLWNRKFSEFFGLPPDELRPGLTYDAIESMAANAIERVRTDKALPKEIYNLVLKDGRWLRYSERATADGGLVSVGADITAIKSQENALKQNDRDLRRTVENLRLSQERIEELAGNYEQEKIRAEEANRSKSEFLANMSHELRTPLNAINGFSEIMAGEMFGPLGDARYSDYVKDILNSGQHLLSLINDILDMSKIEAGKLQLQPEGLEPEALIEQSIRIMRARAEEKQISLIVESEPLPEIEADPRALKQVLLNLMSNAVKFTPEHGKVIVRGYMAADGVVLQVADTGIGIAKEDLPRLGRPFEQIESQHSKIHQGSGLGLALSKSLVEMHGGTLRIDSVLGKGTTVSFCLPLIAEPDEESRLSRPIDEAAINQNAQQEEMPVL
jgi:two-component system cell cycle sensor histidine kinase PleC